MEEVNVVLKLRGYTNFFIGLKTVLLDFSINHIAYVCCVTLCVSQPIMWLQQSASHDSSKMQMCSCNEDL
jgi:hypothetical protein